jgi:hypothetical protein
VIILSGVLVVLAIALLIAGILFGNSGTEVLGLDGLMMIYISITVSIVSALCLAVGVYLRRRELFGKVETVPGGAPKATKKGRKGAEPPAAEPPAEDTFALSMPPVDVPADAVVHVVRGRKRYHLDSCRQLAGRDKEELTYAEAQEEGFSPCTACMPDTALAARAAGSDAGSQATAAGGTAGRGASMTAPPPPAQRGDWMAARTGTGRGLFTPRQTPAEPADTTSGWNDQAADWTVPLAPAADRPAEDRGPGTADDQTSDHTQTSNHSQTSDHAPSAADDRRPSRTEEQASSKGEEKSEAAEAPADSTATAPLAAMPPATEPASEDVVEDDEWHAMAKAASDSAPEQATASDAAAGGDDPQVRILSGTKRYHRAECALIEDIGDDADDLEALSRTEAKAKGCTPCLVCQPDLEHSRD